MRYVKKFFSFINITALVIGFFSAVPAEIRAAETTYTSGDYTYTLGEDEYGDEVATITGYTGSESMLEIPGTLDGYNVYAIGAGAFKNNLNLTNISIGNGISLIKNNAFYKCSKISKLIMSDSITEIQYDAFQDCTKLSDITLSENLKKMGSRAFANTAVTEITIPKSLETCDDYDSNGPFGNCAKLKTVKFEEGTTVIAKSLLAHCTGIEEIEIPDTVTSVGNRALYKCTSLTSISMPKSIVVIGNNAFYGCSSLEEVTIPDSVTEIQYDAFQDCTKLSDITLSENLKKMGSRAFANTAVTEITIPKSLETCDDYDSNGPFGNCAKLKTVKFEEGTTVIAKSLLAHCTGIEEIEIPNTVEVIGNNAFQDCTNLKYINITKSVLKIGDKSFKNCTSLLNIKLGNDLTSIGNDTFSGCQSLTVYCNYYTYSVVSCINQQLSFAPSDEKFVDDENKMLDRKKSYFYANMDSVSAGGYLPMTINFDVKNKWKGELSKQKIVTYIPQYTELIEDSIKLNGIVIDNYSYDANKHQLTIPVNADSGAITYSIKIKSKENVISYAYLSATKNGVVTNQNIDAINESFNGITLSAPDIISNNKIGVSGIAPVSTDVDLYIDGVKQTTVSSLKNGSWYSELTIDDPIDCYIYTIEAKCIDEYDAEISVSKNVSYKKNAPELESLKVEYNEHNVIKTCDMMSTNGTKPRIYYVPNTPFTFKAGFANSSNIDKVYITSTRNNEKKSMEAEYDADLGLYVASGYFDDTNTSYVPGTIGVEYREKNKKVEASESFDITPYQTIMKNDLENAKVDYEVNTDEEVVATIDLSDTALELDKAIVKAGVKYLDTSGFESLEDIYDFCGMEDTIIKYTVPGLNGSEYILNMDFSDPDKINMLLYDGFDTGTTLADKIISLNLDMSEFGSQQYMKWDMANNVLGNVTKATGFAYKAYGIYSDYYELIDEIDMSSNIEDKYAAKQKALELRQDQLAFLALTTVMPLLVAGSTMAAPVLAFSVLLGAMTALSGSIYDMRVANIKCQKFKLNFVVDPSGFVYDSETEEKIEDAIVTAYWIPYDESDDFWNNKPNDSEYGVLWKAGEYEQENPLKTNIDGKYSWDVPEGWWRVKCEKEGYQTVWSEWMTVPPVQTEVNIGMVSEGKSTPNSSGDDPSDGDDSGNQTGENQGDSSGNQTGENQTGENQDDSSGNQNGENQGDNSGNQGSGNEQGNNAAQGGNQQAATPSSGTQRTTGSQSDSGQSQQQSSSTALTGQTTTSQTDGNNVEPPVPASTIAKVSKVTAKNKKGKKLTVTWKWRDDVDKYEIQYALNKKFTKSKKSKKVAGYLDSLTIKKLKKGKTYYVRVRACKKISGVMTYSGWSAVKKVKIKK